MLSTNMDVWRPCDTLESVVAWAAALERTDGPTSLIFSRQNLPFQSRPAGAEEVIRRGGYVLLEPREQPRAVLLATGSEVSLRSRRTARWPSGMSRSASCRCHRRRCSIVSPLAFGDPCCPLS